MSVDFSYFRSLKGELEAEGLSKIELAGELVFSLRNGLDYLVKFSGSEAISDLNYLQRIGVLKVVCPMIESPFAMEKYMNAITGRGFQDIGVTIETKTACGNLKEILEMGEHLTEVTIGRSDLSSSMGISNVEDHKIINIVELVAEESKKQGLDVTMGGGVSLKTINTLQKNQKLFDLIDCVETRKSVIDKEVFMDPDALKNAINLEMTLLENRRKSLKKTLDIVDFRVGQLSKRV